VTNGSAAVELAGSSKGDRVYRGVTTAMALVVPILLCLIAGVVFKAGWPALKAFGLGFYTDSGWDAVNGHFGAAPAVFGTIVSSILALLIATPLAVGVAIFLSEFAPSWLRTPVAFFVDLLAAIPSVVYGLWGILVLVPAIRTYFMPFVKDTLHLGDFPLFSGPAYGPSMFAAGVILAIMILPYISAVTREVLMAVPRSQREAALALGATRWEMIWDAVLPFARSGIIGGIILGLGRALGETMAVTMVIGNTPQVSLSLYAPQYTMSAVLANEFAEATTSLHIDALVEIGLLLFCMTLVINVISRAFIWSLGRQASGTVRVRKTAPVAEAA
jgi:phosphate transport system permease protein